MSLTAFTILVSLMICFKLRFLVLKNLANLTNLVLSLGEIAEEDSLTIATSSIVYFFGYVEVLFFPLKRALARFHLGGIRLEKEELDYLRSFRRFKS